MLKQAKTGPSALVLGAMLLSDGRGRARNGGERSRFAGCGEGRRQRRWSRRGCLAIWPRRQQRPGE